LLSACSSSPTTYDDTNQASATFSGPRYLRGTVGSYGSFINNAPRYVAGYGMVVDLDGTGSNEVPAFMRDWLINEMRRNGLGSVQFGTAQFTPERVLADTGSAVVAIEGLIPPGARRGSKFDVLVSLVDQNSTSLAGGRIFWPTQLSPSGLDRGLAFTQAQATGYGKIFVNPIKPSDQQSGEFQRAGLVVNGGTVLESQTVQFVLNQPSYRISNLIADRINERFEAMDTDNLPTAVAKTDGLIEINIPERFSGQPTELLALIEHLFLDPSPQSVRPQAQALGEALMAEPAERSRPVALAWKGLGRNCMPVLREYYSSANPAVQDAALEAGSWLQDEQCIAPLTSLATKGSADQRVRAARMLAIMSRSSEARKTVRGMLNDPDLAVRLGAYEALVLVNDRTVERLAVRDDKQHKFYIDRVPSEIPSVYAIQGDEQAIVIFGGDIQLPSQVFARVDNSLVLRTLAVDTIPASLEIEYEGKSAYIPIHRCGALTLTPSLLPVKEGGKPEPPDWQVEVGDAQGNTLLVNVRGEALQDAFGSRLLNIPGRGQATEKPRAIGIVRLTKEPGKDAQGKPTPGVAELLGLLAPDEALPLVLRYTPPGERDPRLYRINPTVATLVYSLGYKRDNMHTQFGMNLDFTDVVRALNTLAQQGQIPAPFEARINPLAQRIAQSQRDDKGQARPEITPEELEKLSVPSEPAGTTDAPPQPGPTPASTPEIAPETAPEPTPEPATQPGS